MELLQTSTVLAEIGDKFSRSNLPQIFPPLIRRGNRGPMLRCNGLIENSFTVNDGDKMSVSYGNIVDLHHTLTTIKFEKMGQSFDESYIQKYKVMAIRLYTRHPH